MNKPNEKHTKEKNNITIHKILHKLLDAIKLFYEICKVLIFKFDNQNEFKVNLYKNEVVV